MKFTVAGALLDACVLGVLSDSPTYGYDLTQKLHGDIGVSESTLYPVLRRLLKDGMLTSYDEPFDGRNRRYYQITGKGSQALKEYRGDWQRYAKNIDKLISGGQYDEQN